MRSITTRTGDDGTTGLLFGQRVAKDHPQIEAVGTLDELNAALGAAKAQLGASERHGRIRQQVTEIQRELITLMGEVACAEEDLTRYAGSKFAKLTPAAVSALDEAIATLEAQGLRFDGWATPGANALAAAFDVARATGRRAERRLCALSSYGRKLRPELSQYVNRLADLLWLWAREAEQ
ncbi:MAG: cob(I)yrinic acid a,c-diamide adenosyltransferase [Verrucomicrobia bacterium]|nr:cob(I)yrinic acid a,c-diamide adenosyltransferase [Verrucomicrobiota bacterium]